MAATKETQKAKTPDESRVVMTEMVLPGDTNPLGTVFGGKVMAWIDIAAGMAATRHARKSVVTASIDALHFRAPVKVGEYVHIKARVNYVHHTSMEVGVRVDAENPLTGEMKHTATAYTTFVALDSKGKPSVVPPLEPTTSEDKRRHSEARKRRASRVRLAEEIKGSE